MRSTKNSNQDIFLLLIALLIVPAISFPYNPPVWTYPIYTASYWNVCIGAYNRQYGYWGYLSLHDNQQIYHVIGCLANERWNVHYNCDDGTYCFQSCKQKGKYISTDTYLGELVRPVIRSWCRSLEKFDRVPEPRANNGFYIRSSLPPKKEFGYFYDTLQLGSIPMFGGISDSIVFWLTST